MWFRATIRFLSAGLVTALAAGATPGHADAGSAPSPRIEVQVAANAGGDEATDWEQHPYIVRDGQVDFGVYNGYRRYASTCHTCHGPDGLGSSYAPALVDSLKTMSYATFLDKVANGVQRVTTAQTSVMPSFGEVADIMLNIDHIYAYLKARSNGDVGRGRPTRLPADQDPVYQEYLANK